MSDKWIRASEITTYVYCRRAWWLERVGGYQAHNARELQMGTAYHEEHGRTVQQATRTQRLAYALVLITIGVILFAILKSAGA
ncbi:MAG: Dna2/Cas4 domain-containing protein [Anaerolinea sp.]|nr:Dna2/Cas4 domain-containing protein [Anaerolinea sp.]